jgi:hypothetical protein
VSLDSVSLVGVSLDGVLSGVASPDPVVSVLSVLSGSVLSGWVSPGSLSPGYLSAVMTLDVVLPEPLPPYPRTITGRRMFC